MKTLINPSQITRLKVYPKQETWQYSYKEASRSFFCSSAEGVYDIFGGLHEVFVKLLEEKVSLLITCNNGNS